MIKFNYIIGANIELTVEANVLPAGMGVNYGEADIISVKLNGMDVETDDIYIRSKIGMDSLSSLLEECAAEKGIEEDEDV